MIEESKHLSTELLLKKVTEKYQINKQTLKSLNGNECCVFSYLNTVNGNEYVLKIIHSSHRSSEQLLAEVDWLQFLSYQGIKVALPSLSPQGHYVETIKYDENSYFSCISYEKAKGVIIKEKDFTPEILEIWGATMGRMHKATSLYSNKNQVNKRPEWDENRFLKLVPLFPTSFDRMITVFHTLYDKVKVLPKGKDCYGLIHSDLHHKNFLWYSNSITVIDFDDSEYHWFINDIAKTLYNQTFNFSVKPENREAFAQKFITYFMRGYHKEHSLDPYWLEYFDVFLKFRHIFVLIRKLHSVDFDTLSTKERNDLHRQCSEIESELPLLDLRFDTILK